MTPSTGRLIRESQAADARRDRLAKVTAPCGHSVNEYISAYDCETRENADMVLCRQCNHLMPESDLLALAGGSQ